MKKDEIRMIESTRVVGSSVKRLCRRPLFVAGDTSTQNLDGLVMMMMMMTMMMVSMMMLFLAGVRRHIKINPIF